MLSTFLSQLQSYFSKYFVIGSFCPILAFTFMNGATAYVLSASWRAWIDRNIFNSTAGRGAFAVTSITVAMVLLAYVLSSLVGARGLTATYSSRPRAAVPLL